MKKTPHKNVLKRVRRSINAAKNCGEEYINFKVDPPNAKVANEIVDHFNTGSYSAFTNPFDDGRSVLIIW